MITERSRAVAVSWVAWHRTCDSLPEPYEDVLITDGRRVLCGYRSGAEWYVGEMMVGHRITHWAALPRPAV